IFEGLVSIRFNPFVIAQSGLESHYGLFFWYIQFLDDSLGGFKTLMSVAELMTRVAFPRTAVVQVTGFCRICLVNVPLRNPVIRKLKGIVIFRQFFADAFGQAFYINISVIKRLHIVYPDSREKLFSYFLGLFNNSFSSTHGILRVKRKKHNISNTLLSKFADAVFNAGLGIPHPYFHGYIYKLL